MKSLFQLTCIYIHAHHVTFAKCFMLVEKFTSSQCQIVICKSYFIPVILKNGFNLWCILSCNFSGQHHGGDKFHIVVFPPGNALQDQECTCSPWNAATTFQGGPPAPSPKMLRLVLAQWAVYLNVFGKMRNSSSKISSAAGC